MRTSGFLLPVFSIPSKYGIGCFSKEAYQFVDQLRECNQRYWQILPLGPTSYGDSPYQSFSTFAGNPYFIDLEVLIENGLLTEEECDAADFGDDPTKVDYASLYTSRYDLLYKAYERSNINEDPLFHEFRQANSYWLRDYSLFMAVKDFFKGISFDQWPEDIRYRYSYALEYYQKELYFRIEFYEFLQYEFSKQWAKLKNYANEKGILIIGDIPIYVASDSADVWAHKDLFQMDEEGHPLAIAGCPPDGFSATGQLWGNPLYNWPHNKETGFDWWLHRIDKCRQMYDVVRIDHFRGFDEYFSVPAGDTTAVNGHWEKGPGMDLFLRIREVLGHVEIIAEDLGYITDSVRQLVADSGFPNMKVLEFAFDSRDSSGPQEYLPYNYGKNHVVYTGTHDNETLLGWLSSILPEEVKMVQDYLGRRITKKETMANELIRLAHSSTADTCIIPIQDYLGLDNSARINHPSTLGNNWCWRLTKGQFSPAVMKKITAITETYGRKYWY